MVTKGFIEMISNQFLVLCAHGTLHQYISGQGLVYWVERILFSFWLVRTQCSKQARRCFSLRKGFNTLLCVRQPQAKSLFPGTHSEDRWSWGEDITPNSISSNWFLSQIAFPDVWLPAKEEKKKKIQIWEQTDVKRHNICYSTQLYSSNT